ncbi:unnamed protein product [Calicophoron daubneyi]|uniref:SEC7 domain-containing protein n=1 Tax=Calicophoron daubneyi TaxID=300641 RepID=A0AAV2TKI5_CALDB
MYLTPFLEIIRSEDTTGPITALALSAVDKFLSYGILELPVSADGLPSTGPGSIHSIAVAAEAIADAGTQARFVGTDRSSDEVVLMKVLHLLRTLLLVPAGVLLSDRVVREILQSCFRICFEPKLSELLRRTAELSLGSIIQLFFSRLPSLLTAVVEQCTQKPMTPQRSPSVQSQAIASDATRNTDHLISDESQLHYVFRSDVSVEVSKEVSENNFCSIVDELNTLPPEVGECKCPKATEAVDEKPRQSDSGEAQVFAVDPPQEPSPRPDTVFSNKHDADATALHMMNKASLDVKDVPSESGNISSDPQPYGLPAIHDLLHYLISLLSPERNSDGIISVSLGLVTIALETGADAIASCPSLLQLVQGDLTKHLLLLLYTERVWQFAATLRVCFMLFESMRKHLKLQMEVYLQRLVAISSPDNEATSYERREIALDSVVRLFLVPGLATELYVNYDCDPYCSNLFEDITKMLAKNAYPVDRLLGTHLLSLDALLAVLNTIGTHCIASDHGPLDDSAEVIHISQQIETLETGSDSGFDSVGTMKPGVMTIHRKLCLNRHPVETANLPTREELSAAKARKKLLTFGSEQFNSKPKHGIVFLQQCGILQDPLDPDSLAHFLRENPRLDKRMIGEYLSDRKNEDVLAAYVRQFNFSGVSIDEALRAYLEAFRLPGEAPLIQRIMEHFAEHWYNTNNKPFADVDSAFTLAYAILMLNTDQHNPNSKRQNAPMTAADFKKNLSGMNGTSDFDPTLLDNIFKNIHKHEIVMPSEQTGLVRENYLWKCLLRRATSPQANFIHVQPGTLDADLFDLIWGPTVSAIAFIFDKTLDPVVQNKAVDGFIRCAAIAAHHGMSDVLDNLVISLCKFTTLLTTVDNPETLPVSLGRNAKARLALRLVFVLTSRHADILRYGWHSLLECLLQLFRSNLMADELTESEDFISSSHRVRLTTKGCVAIEKSKSHSRARRGSGSQSNRNEVSVFSSFYQYLTTGSAWSGSADEEDEADDAYPVSSLPLSSVDPNADLKSDSSETGLHNGTKIDDLFGPEYWSSVNSSQIDEQSAVRLTSETVTNCGIPQLIKDTKFLVDPSLTELIKALLRAIRGDSYGTLPPPSDALDTDQADLLYDLSNNTNITKTNGLGTNLSQSVHSVGLEKSGSSSFEGVDVDPSSATLETPCQPFKRSMTLPASHFPSDAHSSGYYPSFCTTGGAASDDCRIFCLELLVRILLHNRDRVSALWPLGQCYLADILLNANEPTPLVERIVVGFLRLATCLLRRHEMASQIFACLHYVLLTRGDYLLLDCPVPPGSSPRKHSNARASSGRSRMASKAQLKNRIGLQIIGGLKELLHNHAADLPDPVTDWQLLFGVLEACGAGLRAPCIPPRHPHYSSLQNVTANRSDEHTKPSVHKGSRGYTSDSEAPGLTYHCPTPPSDQENEKETNTGDPDKLDGATTHASTEVQVSGSLPMEQPNAGSWTMINAVSELPSVAVESKPELNADKKSIEHGTFSSVPENATKSVSAQRLVPSSALGLRITIGSRDPVTLEQAADCLAFLVRDPAHITPENFECCVQALRVFVEACLRRHSKWMIDGLATPGSLSNKRSGHRPDHTNHHSVQTGRETSSPSKSRPRFTSGDSDSESDSDERQSRFQRVVLAKELFLSPTTRAVAIQLLDLIQTLFTRATSIYTEWTRTPAVASVEGSQSVGEVKPDQTNSANLWPKCWRPLLQAIARLCCDCRREVRTDALACLQRSLLSPILQPLSGTQWEECFEQVLFPMLSGFLESIALEEAAVSNAQAGASSEGARDSAANLRYHSVEFADPRMRAIPLLTKVFLQHLRPLHQSAGFHSLWTRMLAYMEHYMQASSSDSLMDAVRESLKNVLLVMYTGTYDTPPILLRDAPEGSPEFLLWKLTAQQLSSFLPELLDQLFPLVPPPPMPHPHSNAPPSVQSSTSVSGPEEPKQEITPESEASETNELVAIVTTQPRPDAQNETAVPVAQPTVAPVSVTSTFDPKPSHPVGTPLHEL